MTFFDIDWGLLAQKIKQPDAFWGILTVLRDENGEINWPAIIQAGLTAGLIASITTILQLNNKVTEMQAVQALRSPAIEQLPGIIARQAFVEQRLIAIETGAASATSERFRASDGARLRAEIETQIQREVQRLEQRIEREMRGKR